jgi:hypothetical protein
VHGVLKLAAQVELAYLVDSHVADLLQSLRAHVVQILAQRRANELVRLLIEVEILPHSPKVTHCEYLLREELGESEKLNPVVLQQADKCAHQHDRKNRPSEVDSLLEHELLVDDLVEMHLLSDYQHQPSLKTGSSYREVPDFADSGLSSHPEGSAPHEEHQLSVLCDYERVLAEHEDLLLQVDVVCDLAKFSLQSGQFKDEHEQVVSGGLD